MKRATLLRRLREIAARQDKELIFVREGGKHSIYRIGDLPLSIPRHREIAEVTAQGLIADAEEGR
ncbi:hypothetical protein MPTA5024_18915 [Microbispora sp. ATCC PTA-5024]|nr:hypothetical protein MPTA5024_18915 [Microbispora sp. ATCC PTA-5024]